MVLNPNLSPDAEANLRARAAAEGKPVERFVLDALNEKLAAVPAGAATPSPASLSVEEWLRRFDAWVKSQPRRGYVADDSRESIYAGRGE